MKKSKASNQIEKYFSEQEISADRIVMLEGDEGKDLIRFWLVPPGAEPPTPFLVVVKPEYFIPVLQLEIAILRRVKTLTRRLNSFIR